METLKLSLFIYSILSLSTSTCSSHVQVTTYLLMTTFTAKTIYLDCYEQQQYADSDIPVPSQQLDQSQTLDAAV